MIEAEKTEPISAVQTHIDLLMDKFNEFADSTFEFFYKWMEFRTITFAEKLKNKTKLAGFILL